MKNQTEYFDNEGAEGTNSTNSNTIAKMSPGSKKKKKAAVIIAGKDAVKAEQEKLDMIIKLHEEEELKSDYVAIYNTVALVGALFLSFLVSLEGYSVDVHEKALCHGSAADVCIDIYHLLISTTVISCLASVIVCVVLLTQLSHVPDWGTEELLRAYGLNLVQMPPTAVAFMFYLFILAMIMNFALTMRNWVGSIAIFQLVLLALWVPRISKKLISVKVSVLEQLLEDPVYLKKVEERKAEGRHSEARAEDLGSFWSSKTNERKTKKSKKKKNKSSFAVEEGV